MTSKRYVTLFRLWEAVSSYLQQSCKDVPKQSQPREHSLQIKGTNNLFKKTYIWAARGPTHIQLIEDIV